MSFESSMLAYSDAWAKNFGGRASYLAAVSIMEAERAVRQFIVDFLKERDLTISRWTVLTIVHLNSIQGRSVTIGEIASSLKVHSSTVTNCIEWLEPRGWLERVPVDGRTVRVDITADGVARLSAIQEELAASRFGLTALDPDGYGRVSDALLPLLA
jgi:DNA-binding MarR family transcriptional regulator